MENIEGSKIEWGYNSNSYYSKEILPKVKNVGQRIITRPMPYENNDDIELIYIRTGSGILYINESAYRIQHGSCARFLSSDFHKVIPNNGESVVIDYLKINTGTSLFVWSITHEYESMNDFQRGNSFPLMLDDENAKEFEKIFDKMFVEKKKNSNYLESLMVYLFMELLGRFQRAFSIGACVNSVEK